MDKDIEDFFANLKDTHTNINHEDFMVAMAMLYMSDFKSFQIGDTVCIYLNILGCSSETRGFVERVDNQNNFMPAYVVSGLNCFDGIHTILQSKMVLTEITKNIWVN